MNNIELIDNIEFVKKDERVHVKLLLQGDELHGFDGNGPSIFDAVSNLMANMNMEFEDLQRVKAVWLVDSGKDRRDILGKFFGVQ